jgi:hypothetical protein
MASKHHPQVDDTIESAELTAIQQSHGDATSRGSNERDGSGLSPEVMPDPIQRRSTFRTFTVMVALFVSRHKLRKQVSGNTLLSALTFNAASSSSPLSSLALSTLPW